ncbi:MAG TPA: hypothetical protein DCE07_00845 [Peptococcaceae bacterium]|nr:hypothetical protein [Peptococcaceae bacterium]
MPGGDEEMLRKIDLLRERMDVSYREARETLEKSNGDLVEALILLEGKRGVWREKLHGRGGQLFFCLKRFFERSAETKLRLKKDEQTIMEIPAAVGMVGLLGMLVSTELAVLGALGTVAALMNRCTLELEHQGDNPVKSA